MFRILLFISLLCYCKVFCDELNDDSSEFFDKFLDVLLNCDCADEYGVSSENEDGMYLPTLRLRLLTSILFVQRLKIDIIYLSMQIVYWVWL